MASGQLWMGFEMIPRLSKDGIDRDKWDMFMQNIKYYYEGDDKVVATMKSIQFCPSYGPRLPFEGHKLLRFDCACAPKDIGRLYPYLGFVTNMATLIFGLRVKPLEFRRQGEAVFYDSQEVLAAVESYERFDKQEDPKGMVCPKPPSVTKHPPSFGITVVPGRGYGLVARHSIAKGECILREQLLFKIPTPSTPTQHEQLVEMRWRALSTSGKQLFISLHNNFPGGHPLSGILKTNMMPCGGIYATISRINHSCIPNSYASSEEETQSTSIYAVRDIEVGEEITISYSADETFDTRQSILKASFGFECDCKICTLPLPSRQLSDARRLEMKQLNNAINWDSIWNEPLWYLRNCKRLLFLAEYEYGDSASFWIARVANDALRVSIAHGDQARASIFAEMCYNARAICEGPYSSGSRLTKQWALNPASHYAFNSLGMWATDQWEAPVTLKKEEFEKWLWREGSYGYVSGTSGQGGLVQGPLIQGKPAQDEVAQGGSVQKGWSCGNFDNWESKWQMLEKWWLRDGRSMDIPARVF
ncbi:hypothetical protein FQN52_008222 [Onygenales sp. PD_12]|nr:hypothetical protein FQN52_008222 [Onygenales sp. PD_12]